MERQYIGARYVPKFFENSETGDSTWASNTVYEPLTIVTWNLNSYTSKKAVPANIGAPNLNPEYWANTGNYNAYIGQVEDRIESVEQDVNDIDTYIDLLYVTPEQYGAVGDGVTDDTQALQDAIDAGSTKKQAVLLRNYYLVTGTINLPDRVTIIGQNANEYGTRVIAVTGVNPVFRANTPRQFISNIIVTHQGDTYDDTIVAFQFNGNTQKNIDTTLENVTCCFVGTGVCIYGRNVNLRSCLFSHCRYGVIVDNSNVDAMRGIHVIDCRFHGIGEEMVGGVELLTTDESAGILLRADRQAQSVQEADVTVYNCISDQGGTFIKGRAHQLQVTGCFIAHYEKPAIVIDGASGQVYPTGGGSTHFGNNFIVGLSGTDGIGQNHSQFPTYAFKITNYGRVNFVSNNFSRQFYICDLNQVYDVAIVCNTIEVLMNALTPQRVLKAVNARVAVVGNTNNDRNIAIAFTDDSSGLAATVINNKNITACSEIPWVQVWSGNSGDAFSDIFNYPHFFVRRTDGKSMVEVYRYAIGNENFCTSSSVLNDSGDVDFVEIGSSNQVSWKRRASDGTVTTLNVPIRAMICNI